MVPIIAIIDQTYDIDKLGTKNVGKEMSQISKGRVRDRNKTWFPELADKSKV